MYHNLHNDLKDYYDSFPGLTKKGVLLTINPTKSYHNHFTNITHRDLINKVFQDMGQLILSVPDQALFILKEFSKNLNNFTMNHEVGEYYNFYKKNYKSIAQVEKLTKKVYEHMWSQINSVPQIIEDLNLSLAAKSSDRLRYYKSNKTDVVFFTIFPTLLNTDSPSIYIVVELNQGGIDRLDEVNAIDFTEAEKGVLHETSRIRGGWMHYGSRKFEVDKTDFENLGQFIKDKIETTPLKSVFLKIETYFALNKVKKDLSHVATD